MNPATLQKINFHVDRITEILSGRIEELKRENESLRRVKGLTINKTQAARYLGISPRHMSRLESRYPDRLRFPISMAQLQDFERFYYANKKRR